MKVEILKTRYHPQIGLVHKGDTWYLPEAVAIELIGRGVARELPPDEEEELLP